MRALSGDPGAGKSSFTKMFAAAHASSSIVRVIYIPLQHFDVQSDLANALDAFFASKENIPDDAIRKATGRLLLIFDGLDELSKRGRAAANLADEFLADLKRYISIRNLESLKILALVSGRPISIHNTNRHFRGDQVYYLLPYYIEEGDRESYTDPRSLLKTDQRNVWWKSFGKLIGKRYAGLPDHLSGYELEEITSQPLLNYLLALSLQRNKLSIDGLHNLNALYLDLLHAVHDRAYSTKHVAVGDLDFPAFVRFLEEIGLAVWHGDGRSATVKSIAQHCANSGLSKLMEKFEADAKLGVARLLIAFYFRQRGHDYDGDDTFEFTHKSFGEYLAALRLVRAVSRIHSELLRKNDDPDAGWTWRDALVHWAQVCGPTPISLDILQFVQNELHLRKSDEVAEWQKSLHRLLQLSLIHGMPMDVTGTHFRYKTAYAHACNAEETLMAVVSSCAAVTSNRITDLWQSPTSAREWIHRLQGNRNHVATYFSFVDLTEQDLSALDLRNANLSFAVLDRVDARGSCFDEAYLYHTVADGGSFQRASFVGAELIDAVMHSCNFEAADFQGADLAGADLTEAECEGANFSEASLYRATLVSALFNDCDFNCARFDGASVKDANFIGASLSGAYPEGCDWSEATIGKSSMERPR
jgi:hypothetical protein